MIKALVPLAMGVLVVACAGGRDRVSAVPHQLTGKEWTVEDVAGRGLIDSSHLTLSFSPEGRLSGSGGCNRLIGSYTRRGSRLIIAHPGMTMMACPPALMKQERRFAEILGKVQRYEIDRTGALVLTSGAGQTITAR